MKLLKSITKEEFNDIVDIRFKSILDGFNNYLYINIVGSEEKDFEYKEQCFLNFIERIFKVEEEIIIDFYIKKINGENILKILEILDYEEKVLLLNQINFIKEDTVYFKCKDLDILKMIMKLNTREIFFCTMYFKNIEGTLWGNYGLKFPMFTKSKEEINKYKTMALEEGLLVE